MGGLPITTALEISRKRAEITVCMRTHADLATEAARGSFKARNARAVLHREFDQLYDEWCILRIRQEVERFNA